MISKYTKTMQIGHNVYAIYNTLMLQPVFISEEELKRIKDELLSESEAFELKKRGILIDRIDQDEKAVNIIRDKYLQNSNTISVLYLLVSNTCNLKCKYCFIDKNETEDSNLQTQFMSFEIAKIAIDKFWAHCQRNESSKRDVIFYGGEPLLNDNVILQILEYSKKNNMDLNFAIVTNGVLLNDDVIEKLKGYNVSIGISIDGPEAIHDKNRVDIHGHGTYNSVIGKIENMRKRNLTVGLSITLSEDVLGIGDELISWIKDTGIKSVNFNLLHFYEKDEKRWTDYYNEATDFLIKAYCEIGRLGYSEGRIMRKINSFSNRIFRFADCAAVSASQISIKPSGDVCICHGYAKNSKYDLGNIADIDFPDILKHKTTLKWLYKPTIFHEECLECDSIFICGSGCALQSEVLFDDMYALDKPFCIHTKKMMRWLLEELYKVEQSG